MATSFAKATTVNHELLPSGPYGAVCLDLEAGESVRVEPAALLAMSAGVELGSSVSGGLLGLLQKKADQPERRVRFQTIYTAKEGPGRLMLAPSHAGEIYPMDLDRHTLLVQSLNILACDLRLEIDEEVPNGGLFFAADGGRSEQYLVEVKGTGKLVLAACGSPHLLSLAPGERYLVDTAHVMAFEKRLAFSVRQATDEAWLRLASAEGLVADFEGPGEVLLQTRSVSALSERLSMFR